MAVLLCCMVFFGGDVVFDAIEHAQTGTKYSFEERVHVFFEALAVISLAYAVKTLKAYLSLLELQAEGSRETIDMLRGNFDEVMSKKFGEWGLTQAEQDVTLLIIRGLSVAEIACVRNTAQGTVKAQSTSVFRKVGVRSKTALMSAIIDEFLAVEGR